MKIPISVTAYNWIANENPHPKNPRVAGGGRENRQSDSENAVLLITEIPISVTAYNGNPYIRYCVQWKALHTLLRRMDIPIS